MRIYISFALALASSPCCTDSIRDIEDEVTTSDTKDARIRAPRGSQPYRSLYNEQGKKWNCTTVGSSGVGAGKQCLFPFEFLGTFYKGCTTFSHTEFWCATETNRRGEMKAEQWGECSSNCPKAACSAATPNGYCSTEFFCSKGVCKACADVTDQSECMDSCSLKGWIWQTGACKGQKCNVDADCNEPYFCLREHCQVPYVKITNGMCEESGYSPITSKFDCEAAAAAFKMPDRTVDQLSSISLPKGCYIGGHSTGNWQLYYNTVNTSIGARKSKHLLCNQVKEKKMNKDDGPSWSQEFGPAENHIFGQTESGGRCWKDLLPNFSDPNSGQTKRWLRVILPACIVLVFVVVGLCFSIKYGKDDEEPDDVVNNDPPNLDHPLLKRNLTSEVKDVLHPEPRLADQFKSYCSVSRMVAFAITISICILIGGLVDPGEFAVWKRANDVSHIHDCMFACKNYKEGRTQCDVARGELTFNHHFCDKNLRCASSLEELKKISDTPILDKSSYLEDQKCFFKVLPEGWKIDFVLCSIVMGILIIVQGGSPDTILIGLSGIFAVCGIITRQEALAGLSSPAMVALAVLFPIASAVEETHILDTIISVMLGNPTTLFGALFRMMSLVAVLSALLSNTAIVQLMIPVVVTWSRRLDVAPGKLLMPLSFAAQLGGTCTLVGSSHCLVAKNSVPRAIYDMGFFDLSPVGSVTAICTFCYIAICLPLLHSSAEGASAAESQSTDNTHAIFEVVFRVRSYSTLVGMRSEDLIAQLERMQGVKEVSFLDGIERSKVQANDKLKIKAVSEGVAALRQVKRDLAIENNDDLKKLGEQRNFRHLYEAVVRSDSALVGISVDVGVMRQVLGACFIAINGRERNATDVLEHVKPKIGDLLLLEADQRYVNREAWLHELAVGRKVPESSPPEPGRIQDRLRSFVICACMVIFIALAAIEYVDIATGGFVFVFGLVIADFYTKDELLSKLKPTVLLTIAGAAGLSAALSETGLANFAAVQMKRLAQPTGVHGLRAAIYLFGAFMSMFMNNSAVIAIVGPMLEGMMTQDQLETPETKEKALKCLLFVLVFGAGTCMTTPLGYQTNLMVMPEGGYTFGDFLRLGLPVQVLHAITVLVLVYIFHDVLNL